MRVFVYGLGHLGCVTAAGLAHRGHIVELLDRPMPPTGEPDLEEMIQSGIESGRIRWSGIWPDNIETMWVTFDTPVDGEDTAAVEEVLQEIDRAMPHLQTDVLVILSCQLPVGTIAGLEAEYPLATFVCIPENLRHGTAVKNFLLPDRIIVGTRGGKGHEKIADLLTPITGNVEWMSIESAEMTKHAINAWMAMSICYANEIAAICKKVGANPAEVERGLRTEERIGKKAYIRPGGPYTGKTLARDLEYLQRMRGEVETPLLSSIKPSNKAHKRRGDA